MKRLRIVIGVVAMLAVAITATASASAATPEWYECVKVGKSGKTYLGEYKDRACNVPSATKGKYDRHRGIGAARRLKGKSHLAVLHVVTYAGDAYVECKKTNDSAVPATPNREEDFEVTLRKCELQGKRHERCSSAGRSPGEIRFRNMEGELGYLQESPAVVGLRLESSEEPGPEGEIASFSCGAQLSATFTGRLIGVEQGIVNEFGKRSELVLTAAENLGALETEGKPYAPLVNLLGFAGEEGAPQVLHATLCGMLIESMLGSECSPSEYAGLTVTVRSKSEGRMIKA
jgi:hypothetical protein